MNRHQRRSAGKVSGLRKNELVVLKALIRCWLSDTEPGQMMLGLYSMDDAIHHTLELFDKGLVRFVQGPGTLGDGETSFAIEAVPPPRWHYEGGHA